MLLDATFKEYIEDGEQSGFIKFEINDLLLTGMILMRLYFITRSLLNTSNYVEPRAQRVC
jgi:hypothetical protein